MVNGHLLTNITGEQVSQFPPTDVAAYQRQQFCSIMDGLLFPGIFSSMPLLSVARAVLSIYVKENCF